MKKKIFLLLAFLLVFSIFNFESEGYKSQHKKYTESSRDRGDKESTYESNAATTSEGEKAFDPTGGGVFTEEDFNQILMEEGVENFEEYSFEDILNNPELFQIIVNNLGFSPTIILPNQAILSSEGDIITHEGPTYSSEDILVIFKKKGIGVIESDNKISETLKSEEVMKILKKELNVNKIINSLEDISKGKLIRLCRGDTIWNGIISINQKVLKYIEPVTECRFRCNDGKCVEKVVVQSSEQEELIEKKSAITVKKKDKIEDKTEFKKIEFRELQPLSVKKISSIVKRFASSECNPRCEHNCGQPNGCGGFCGNEDGEQQGECGNPIRREVEPITPEEVFISTTIGVSDMTQLFFDFIFN